MSDWRKEAESARSEADQLREEKDRIKKELEEKIRNLNESHQEEWRKEKKRTTVGMPFCTRFSLVGRNSHKTFFYVHHFKIILNSLTLYCRQGPGAGTRSRVFPGAVALNFPHAPGLLLFFNILLNLFFFFFFTT